ncbi:MAG: hypothetical protein BWZ02_03093 [Lentisphaerae bacterium ADurb.BinA184]|nr:MAG: hypothetical protein BWZ02_03093 [Lentisphaerae bacterium ADurb.BinA184]
MIVRRRPDNHGQPPAVGRNVGRYQRGVLRAGQRSYVSRGVQHFDERDLRRPPVEQDALAVRHPGPRQPAIRAELCGPAAGKGEPQDRLPQRRRVTERHARAVARDRHRVFLPRRRGEGRRAPGGQVLDPHLVGSGAVADERQPAAVRGYRRPVRVRRTGGQPGQPAGRLAAGTEGQTPDIRLPGQDGEGQDAVLRNGRVVLPPGAEGELLGGAARPPVARRNRQPPDIGLAAGSGRENDVSGGGPAVGQYPAMRPARLGGAQPPPVEHLPRQRSYGRPAVHRGHPPVPVVPVRLAGHPLPDADESHVAPVRGPDRVGGIGETGLHLDRIPAFGRHDERLGGAEGPLAGPVRQAAAVRGKPRPVAPARQQGPPAAKRRNDVDAVEFALLPVGDQGAVRRERRLHLVPRIVGQADRNPAGAPLQPDIQAARSAAVRDIRDQLAAARQRRLEGQARIRGKPLQRRRRRPAAGIRPARQQDRRQHQRGKARGDRPIPELRGCAESPLPGRRNRPPGDGRDVGASGHLDQDGVVLSLGGVVLVELLPEAARLHPHDRIHTRVVGGLAVEDLYGQDRFLQPVRAAGKRLLDDELQEAAQAFRVPEKRAAQQPVELCTDGIRRDGIPARPRPADHSERRIHCRSHCNYIRLSGGHAGGVPGALRSVLTRVRRRYLRNSNGLPPGSSHVRSRRDTTRSGPSPFMIG